MTTGEAAMSKKAHPVLSWRTVRGEDAASDDGVHSRLRIVRRNKMKEAEPWVGYYDEVHRKSGGICVYCDYGKGKLDFDLWRQLSLEHVIPEAWLDWKLLQGLLERLLAPYPIDLFERRKRGSTELPKSRKLRQDIEIACCATACHSCNSMASGFERRHGTDYRRRFFDIFKSPSIKKANGFDDQREAILEDIRGLQDEILGIKKRDVKKRIQDLRRHFDDHIRSGLAANRR